MAAFTLPCVPQSFPPTAPTQPAAAAQTSRYQARVQPPTRRATVNFTAGQLLITADNSSLNQILRDIARVTGMTITGGVADERVFGTYGPADTSTVLSALLNGTGSNMLLLQNSSQSPQQLVLTPRQGGPTPPSPNAAPHEADDNPDLPPQLNPRFNRQPFAPFAPTNPSGALPTAPPATFTPQPTAPSASPSSAPNPAPPSPTADGLTSTPTPPLADTTTQQSPNGVKTPQQIYDQLMLLQQQQAKPPQQP